MLDLTRTRVDKHYELDALAAAPFTTNGSVVQGVMDGNKMKGRPSNATADTIYMGFSWGIPMGSTVTSTKVEQKKAVASVVLLTNVSTGTSDMTVFAGTGYGGTQLTPTADANTAPANNTQYQLGADGKTITLHSSLATADVFAIYRYSPSYAQARYLYGDVQPQQNAAAQFGRVGVVTSGLIYTDQFNTAINWVQQDTLTTAEVLRGGANGRVTVGGTGCEIKGGKVAHVPSVDYPFLGISIGLVV